MKKIRYPFLESYVSAKRTIILFVLSVSFATIIITSLFGIVQIDSEATMDSLTYYSSKTFYNNLDVLGAEGRVSYLILHLFDYVFMVVLMLFLISLLTLLRRRSFKLIYNMTFISYLPIISFIGDFIENISIDLSILIYPRTIRAFGILSGYATSIKMYSLYFIFTIIILISLNNFFLLIAKYIKKRQL